MEARTSILGALVLALGLAACQPAPAASSARAAAPSERLPRGLPYRLEDTGLYADFHARRIAPGVVAYSPQYPLWTDGARKSRWMSLPEGSAIEASDPERWRFPVGTKLWKEFSFERRIETRYMELCSDGTWLGASYLWNEDESDAVLAPERGVRAACESSPGVPYDVPARADCAACHQSGAEVLGVSALQLSPDRDPFAPHAELPPPAALDLAELVALGLVANLPRELLDTPPRIAARSPYERAALGYLAANCGACHRAGGLLDALALDLASSSGALASTVGHELRCAPPGGAAQVRARIEPGEPERSALLARMATREPRVQMPPLGTHAPDREALELLGAWIRELRTLPETH